MASLKNELLAAFRAERLSQTRTMNVAMSTLVVTVAGLAFAAARLVQPIRLLDIGGAGGGDP